MIDIKGVGEFFSLDIGTNSIRAAQLSKSGDGSWNLVGMGYTSVDPQIILSDSEESKRKLSEVIASMLGQSDIKTKNVVINLPSQKTFTTIIEVPNQDKKELARNIEYQVDQYIPISLDDAKFDWALIGASLSKQDYLEILLASTSKKFSEEKMEFVEGLGLNVVASEPESLAMTRALYSGEIENRAQLFINFNETSTDLSAGLFSLVKSASQNLNIKEDQARQFILKFGLAKDKLEGQVFRAIEMTLDNFAQEITKSIKFFSTKYPDIPVGSVNLSGYVGTIPQMSEYIASKTGVQTYSSNPFQNINVPAKYQQQVMNVGNEFAVAVGLAKRSNR